VSSPYHITCEECGREVDERFETVWSAVEGWEKKRHQGGTNHIACRRPLPRFRCEPCMQKILAGLPALQGSLWDAE
jgi:hypothetical protein